MASSLISTMRNRPLTCCLLLVSSTEAFVPLTLPSSLVNFPKSTQSSLSMIYAPPGSGYARPEDEESTFPDTYLPMMEYPGTMRPGRTPENMPFQDLPIGDNDPDPVPWPHFQQIDWHHRWDPPHPNPIDMEEFIEMQGRWATPEMEAAMRVGARRGVREKQEKEDRERGNFVITDDDEDDDKDEPVSLGESVFGELGSAADQAITADAVQPRADGDDEEEADSEGTDDDDLDNFLLDLGLDAEMDVDAMGDDDSPAPSTKKKSKPPVDDDFEESTLDLLSEGGDISGTISVDDDDLDLGLDDDDDDDMSDGGVSTVPLDDFGDEDDLEGEDIFDDGGFDFDGDFDDGDVW